jgi:predicted glycoside hydrolase/deacetylase ChbG (UPF0249 family)
MVFMGDSKRATQLAKDCQLDDVGLHLNFSEEFSDASCPETLKEQQTRIVRFLRRNKYAQLVYNPFLRKAFASSYHAQMEEFVRLFEKSPSHIDGHHHMHLCANLLWASRCRLVPEFAGTSPFGPEKRVHGTAATAHLSIGGLLGGTSLRIISST